MQCCTGAAELLALDLADAFVGKPARAGAAGAAGLDGVGAQVVGQPFQITVTDEGILSQMPAVTQTHSPDQHPHVYSHS